MFIGSIACSPLRVTQCFLPACLCLHSQLTRAIPHLLQNVPPLAGIRRPVNRNPHCGIHVDGRRTGLGATTRLRSLPGRPRGGYWHDTHAKEELAHIGFSALRRLVPGGSTSSVAEPTAAERLEAVLLGMDITLEGGEEACSQMTSVAEIVQAASDVRRAVCREPTSSRVYAHHAQVQLDRSRTPAAQNA